MSVNEKIHYGKCKCGTLIASIPFSVEYKGHTYNFEPQCLFFEENWMYLTKKYRAVMICEKCHMQASIETFKYNPINIDIYPKNDISISVKRFTGTPFLSEANLPIIISYGV